MKKTLYAIVLVVAASSSHAQVKTDTMSAWALSHNLAGLTTISSGLSEAHLSFGAAQGKMHNPNDAERLLTYGAEASSVVRISPATVFSGNISYNHLLGKKMGGSVMLNPYDVPFNITEHDDNNRGEKAMDYYQLSGAVGTDVGKGFSLGAGIDYSAANYAKRKDPRHKNSYMNLRFSPGITWQFPKEKGLNHSQIYTIGLNYSYQRSVESLSFRIYGRQDEVAHYLIDFGGYYGIDEQADGTGYTDPSVEKPLYDERHGASLQIESKSGSGLSWFAMLSAAHRHGHYGEKSPSLVSLSQHSGTEGGVLLRLSIRSGIEKHFITLTTDLAKLSNYERVSRFVSGNGGASDVIYYGKRKAGERTTQAFRGSYEGFLDTRLLTVPLNKGFASYHPYHVFASIGCQMIDRLAMLYPHSHNQKLTIWDISVAAERSLSAGKSVITVGFQPSIFFGSHSVSYHVYTDDFEEQTPPASSQLYMQREKEFLTSTKLGLSASVRCDFPLLKELIGYAKLSYDYRHAFGVEALEGANRHGTMLSLGCVF